MNGERAWLRVATSRVSLQKEGEFTLHGRAILEMEQYIRETYPDAVKICNICHSLLIQVPAGQGMGAHCWTLSSWGSAQVLPESWLWTQPSCTAGASSHKSWWRPSPRTCQRTPPHGGLQGRTASLLSGSAVGVQGLSLTLFFSGRFCATCIILAVLWQSIWQSVSITCCFPEWSTPVCRALQPLNQHGH